MIHENGGILQRDMLKRIIFIPLYIYLRFICVENLRQTRNIFI